LAVVFLCSDQRTIIILRFFRSRKPRPAPQVSYPRILHALWLQGLENAPPLVRFNLDRWVRLNPGYRLNVLDQADVDRLLDGAPIWRDGMEPQALSNVVRTRLLMQQGGVWIDASLFPVKPLDDWLPEAIEPEGFFAFARPAPDRLLSTWMLAATPDHPLVVAWWGELLRFWTRPRQLLLDIPDDPVATVRPPYAEAVATYNYFTHHYLFAYLMETRPDLAAIWQRCPQPSAGPPHRLQALFGFGPDPDKKAIRKAAIATPVQKLNWRVTYPLDAFNDLK
jgi:hypothetical protein